MKPFLFSVEVKVPTPRRTHWQLVALVQAFSRADGMRRAVAHLPYGQDHLRLSDAIRTLAAFDVDCITDQEVLDWNRQEGGSHLPEFLLDPLELLGAMGGEEYDEEARSRKAWLEMVEGE